MLSKETVLNANSSWEIDHKLLLELRKSSSVFESVKLKASNGKNKNLFPLGGINHINQKMPLYYCKN